MRRIATATGIGLALAIMAVGCSSSGSSSSSTPSTSSAGSAVIQPTTPSTPTGASGTVPGTTGAAAQPTSSPATVPAGTTTLPGAVDPNAPELVEPGDIPDNQVFIPFTSADGTYSVKVPEGWARTEAGGVVTFSDKYNSIAIQASAAAAAPTVDSVKATGLADVSSDTTFTLTDVQPVTRKAGTGVLATYEIGSPPNPVTGKKALLAVERYVFSHNGTVVTLTLSGAKGADNVDPWKIVSDSLAWA
ncbi:MAG: hypothetical protein QOE09_3496 [Ilumatobacteraceae bacterium]